MKQVKAKKASRKKLTPRVSPVAERAAPVEVPTRQPKKYHRIVYDEFGRVKLYQETPDSPTYIRTHDGGVVDRVLNETKDVKLGTATKGKRGRKRKYTDDQIRDIVSQHVGTGAKLGETATKYNVSPATISNWVKAFTGETK